MRIYRRITRIPALAAHLLPAVFLASCTLEPTSDTETDSISTDKASVALGLPLVCPPGFSTEGNGFTIDRAEIRDGKYHLELLHGAGCGEHKFTACFLNEQDSEWGSPGDVITTGVVDEIGEVPMAQIALQHVTDNVCEAVGFTKLEIDLSRLATFARSGKNGMNSEGIASDFTGEDVWVELLGGNIDPIQLPFEIQEPTGHEATFVLAAEHANWTSEMDSGPVYIEARNSSTTGPTARKIRKAFGIDASLAIRAYSRQDTNAELEWLAFDPSWMAIQTFMADRTGTTYRLYKIGPADENGKLADDQGSYTYLVIGKSKSNSRRLIGFYARAVET